MKICTDCVHHAARGVDGPMGLQVGYLCDHKECRDPVDGSAIPCAAARRESVFCGIQARYFEQQQEEPEKEPASVIELVK